MSSASSPYSMPTPRGLEGLRRQHVKDLQAIRGQEYRRWAHALRVHVKALLSDPYRVETVPTPLFFPFPPRFRRELRSMGWDAVETVIYADNFDVVKERVIYGFTPTHKVSDAIGPVMSGVIFVPISDGSSEQHETEAAVAEDGFDSADDELVDAFKGARAAGQSDSAKTTPTTDAK